MHILDMYAPNIQPVSSGDFKTDEQLPYKKGDYATLDSTYNTVSESIIKYVFTALCMDCFLYTAGNAKT